MIYHDLLLFFVLPRSKFGEHIVFSQPVFPFETVILIITFKQRGLELYYLTWMTRPFLGTNIPDNTIYLFKILFSPRWLNSRVFTSHAGDQGSISGRDIQVIKTGIDSRCECHGSSEMTIVNQSPVSH